MADNEFSALAHLLKSRRSVRSFTHDPVDPQLLDDILEAVRFSPSPTNRVCTKFVAVSNTVLLQAMRQDVMRKADEISQKLDRETAETFREYSKWFSFFDQAPVVLFGLFRIFASRLPAGDENGPKLEGVAEVQAFGGAVHALLLGLHSVGLSSCWMSGPLIAEMQLEHLLQVERPWRLGAVLPVGWPAKKPPVPKKPELEQFFTWFGGRPEKNGA